MPSVRRAVVPIVISLLPAGCTDWQDAPQPDCHQGVLIDDGGRCQALRRRDGSIVTFHADMNGWRLGQQACVCGPKAIMTQCPRETAIEAVWLAPFCPPTTSAR